MKTHLTVLGGWKNRIITRQTDAWIASDGRYAATILGCERGWYYGYDIALFGGRLSGLFDTPKYVPRGGTLTIDGRINV